MKHDNLIVDKGNLKLQLDDSKKLQTLMDRIYLRSPSTSIINVKFNEQTGQFNCELTLVDSNCRFNIQTNSNSFDSLLKSVQKQTEAKLTAWNKERLQHLKTGFGQMQSA